MHLYFIQLLEDLEKAATNPPEPAYIEPPPYLEDNPAAAELALVPYKSISEWTGIPQEVFPDMTQLTAMQMDNVNKAILKVFDSLNIELIDAPANLPPEILYDVLTTHWDIHVQYLPSTGYDLELCSGDPDSCPYGEYCDCGEEDIFGDDVIPPTSIIDEENDNGLPF